MNQSANILYKDRFPDNKRLVSDRNHLSFSFVNFIIGVPTNKKYLLLAIGVSIVQFIIFKVFYPYPDFFSDSYSYLFAAYEHLDISIWPIGYSKFLSAFHAITYSDTAFVGAQYFLSVLSAIYFFFTILYFYKPGGSSQAIMFIFLFFSPLSLYLSNTINSDALFGALSLLWFTQLIWIIQRPKLYQLFLHALLLFFCFTVRNNAYYYPVISLVAFAFSRQKLWFKSAGIILPALLIIPFIIHTRNEAYKITGTKQFSLFTGWQLANNALYIYDKIDVDSTTLTTPGALELNRISQSFFKRINRNGYRDYLEAYVGNLFIRQPEAPLKQFFFRHYKADNDFILIKSWGEASAEFEPFGRAIIMKNPIAYARYFMLPNVEHYLLPPLSHLKVYNYGTSEIEHIAQVWFHYKSEDITATSKTIQGEILSLYPILFMIINVLFLVSTILFLAKKYFKRLPPDTNRVLLLVIFFLALNFAFSVFTTLNILRYQFIPMIVCFSFTLMLVEWLTKEEAK